MVNNKGDDNMIQVGILGTGSYVPKKVMTNDDIAQIVDTNNEWILSRTGISERHVAENEDTSDMAVAAAEKALDMAGIEKSDIDFILVATGTPDYPIPCTACRVQSKMNLPMIGSMDISCGCAGFIYGLSIAEGFVKSGMYRHVLVISSEILTKHIDWSNRATCILFGDGACAAVVGEVSKGYGFCAGDFGTDGHAWDAIHIPAGGVDYPLNDEALHNGDIYLHMDGKKVFISAVKNMEHTVLNSLDKAGLQKEDISYYLFHQANMRILLNLSERMDLPLDKIPKNLDRLGNTGPASIGIALDELVRSHKVNDGDYLMLAGFGAGFIWGSQIIRWKSL